MRNELGLPRHSLLAITPSWFRSRSAYSICVLAVPVVPVTDDCVDAVPLPQYTTPPDPGTPHSPNVRLYSSEFRMSWPTRWRSHGPALLRDDRSRSRLRWRPRMWR